MKGKRVKRLLKCVPIFEALNHEYKQEGVYTHAEVDAKMAMANDWGQFLSRARKFAKFQRADY